eukprot:SAG11_NODE_28478_length_321_cov_0.783784_1_plen_44_part_01
MSVGSNRFALAFASATPSHRPAIQPRVPPKISFGVERIERCYPG